IPTPYSRPEGVENVQKILSSRGIRQVLLVTSAMHIPRSLQIFRRRGINVIPAPTDFLVSEGELRELGSTPKAAILNLLPDIENLHQFTIALKEYIGSFIYRLRGWL
ncbi:MAG: YdcF family protein, partial [Nostoc sp.]